MSTYSDHDCWSWSERIAELGGEAAVREREFREARASLERELTDYLREVVPPGQGQRRSRGESAKQARPEARRGRPREAGRRAGHARADRDRAARGPADDDWADPDGAHQDWADRDRTSRDRISPDRADRDRIGRARAGARGGRGGWDPTPLTPEDRTEALISGGRRSARPAMASRRRKVSLAAVAITGLVAVAGIVLTRNGPGWPASVAVVRTEAAKACENPNVASEPTQVNFACGQDTRQILWVFALLTSNDNPAFSDTQTGRQGLEPISPAQGGDVAWSLDLHHPYSPGNPIDSLQVAARAINNIIGGVTLTGPGGRPDVLPGLESDPDNCARYSGSPAVIARQGYPRICARPVTGLAREGALVSDVFRKWVVGAPPAEAHDAAVLFEHSRDPGNAQVQAILRTVAPPSPSRA